jgi:hypothetical protein
MSIFKRKKRLAPSSIANNEMFLTLSRINLGDSQATPANADVGA